MARTFLFLYVFTVPFAMLSDKSSDVAHCFMVFLLTYGFVGLEVVAIELDNPFGKDANDFDVRYVKGEWLLLLLFLLGSSFQSLCCEFTTDVGSHPIVRSCLVGVPSAMAMTAYEDIYLTILDMDGPEWTGKLRARMHDNDPSSSADVLTEQSRLLSTAV